MVDNYIIKYKCREIYAIKSNVHKTTVNERLYRRRLLVFRDNIRIQEKTVEKNRLIKSRHLAKGK